jgi:hypothetical protein
VSGTVATGPLTPAGRAAWEALFRGYNDRPGPV